ncbi:unnamed protein product [Trichobilharzia regenti]|nr:unnamed protein product [Trichobilharzia regenti]
MYEIISLIYISPAKICVCNPSFFSTLSFQQQQQINYPLQINNVNIEAAYHRLQKDNAKLIAELSCLLKPTGGCSGTKQSAHRI